MRNIGIAVLVAGFIAGMAGICSAEVAVSKTPLIVADANSVTAPATEKKKERMPMDTDVQKITVKVVDKETDKPLAGAEVKAGSDKYGPQETTTDQDGVAAINISRDSQAVAIGAMYPKYVGLICQFWGGDVKDLPDVLTLRLKKGVEIGGIVTDMEGAPIGGAKVRISMRGGPDERTNKTGEAMVSGTVMTGPDGKWRFDGATDDVNNLWLGFEHAKYISVSVKGAEAGGGSLKDGSFKVAMKKGSVVRGIVRKMDGSPVKGARIVLGGYSSGDTKVTTNDEGRFELANAEEGDQIVTVKAKHFAPELKTIPAEEMGRELEFILGPEHVLRGMVVDGNGKGRANASVQIIRWRDYVTINKTTRCDADGKFEIDSLPGDAMDIRVLHGLSSMLVFKDVIADGNERIFVLSELRVKGRVTDAETGKPIASLAVMPGVCEKTSSGMSWQDAKTYTGGQYEYVFEAAWPKNAIRIKAEGYNPATSREIEPNEKSVVCDFKLTRSTKSSGTVYLPDGKPASGVKVYIVAQGPALQLENGEVPKWDRHEFVTTRADGAFKISIPEEPYGIVALGKAGVAVMTGDALAQTGKVTLKAWGRIEGEYRIGSKPGGKRELWLQHGEPIPDALLGTRDKMVTDENGRFVIAKVVPGYARLHYQPMMVPAGATLNVRFGGTGRMVTGKLPEPEGENYRTSKLEWGVSIEKAEAPNVYAHVPWPQNADSMPAAELSKWLEEWRKTPEAKEVWNKMMKKEDMTPRVSLTVKQDGTFEAENVEPGKWILWGPVWNRASLESKIIGNVFVEFEVPQIAEGQLDEPLDLGTVKVFQGPPKAGDVAPGFELDGVGVDKVRLKDSAGKVVLVYFYQPSGQMDGQDLPEMRKIFAAYGKRDDFAMVGVMLGLKEIATTRVWAREAALPWPQAYAYIGKHTKVKTEYGVDKGPMTILIGRDGKIIATGLTGEELAKKVEETLAANR